MAREYGRLMLSVWDDKHYQDLSLREQGMFCALLSYPGISWCGVIDFIPKRLIRISNELTGTELVKLLNRLSSANFIVADSATDEILIRRFVYYDGILKMPNVAKAMAKSVDRIQSPLLRDVVIAELARVWITDPHLSGWGENGLEQGFGVLLQEIEMAADVLLSPNPSPNPSGNPSVNGSLNPSIDPWAK